RVRNSVGTRGLAFAAQWLAYTLPYRRFVSVLTDANARLGADVDRYSFIVVDLHHLLLAGLPAHFESSRPQPGPRPLIAQLFLLLRLPLFCRHLPHVFNAYANPICGRDELRALSRSECSRKSLRRHFVV